MSTFTTLSDIFDLGELNTEIDAGYVKCNQHPTLPLRIYTYTRNCQYDAHWTPVTTQCRGLIADHDGNIIARPFPKFFNYGEHGVREYAAPLAVEPFEVYEKVDGSLGILFYYEGYWRIASKGSFISEQARWGQKLIDANYADLSGLDDYLTYCCEIIYPENRIVVNYGDRSDLVLLGAFTPDGREIPLSEIVPYWYIGSVVKSYEAPTLDDLLARCEANASMVGAINIIGGTDAEGFVLRYQSGHRVKVKYSEYVRLHRILTGVSERDIWRAVAFDDMACLNLSKEALSRALKCSTDEVVGMASSPNCALATIVEGCPDEFDQWVQKISLRLRQDFNIMTIEAKLLFAKVRELVGLDDRALFAKTLTGQFGDNKTMVSAVFSMLDEKPVGPLLWRALYPAASTPFVEDEEG